MEYLNGETLINMYCSNLSTQEKYSLNLLLNNNQLSPIYLLILNNQSMSKLIKFKSVQTKHSSLLLDTKKIKYG